MAVLTYSQIQDLVLDEVVGNVTTDAPIATGASSELDRAINDAYSIIWEESGGSAIAATSATLWTPAQSADTTGVATGIITSINQVTQVWATTTSASTGGGAGDVPLDPVDLAFIEFMRANSSSTVGAGTYATPKVYNVRRLATTTPASVNLLQLNYWPGVVGFYFPAHYMPQFTAIDPVTVTTPDVNDIQSRDIAYMAAMTVAPRVGRQELMPSIAMKLSESTRLMLERRTLALADARADR